MKRPKIKNPFAGQKHAKTKFLNRQRAVRKNLRIYLKKRGHNVYQAKLKDMVHLFAKINKLTVGENWRAWIFARFHDGNIPDFKVYTQRGLETGKWKDVCRKVYSMYENKCMCCGSGDNLSVDHIKPLRYYPELGLEIDNMQILCRSCNSRKNTKIIDYRNGVGSGIAV